jgi:hypothetical protein
MVLARQQKQCNFLEWHDLKVIYKRYASLYFIACVDPDDNELIVLETIHHFVEVLDRYFGNVCELDLIFNFHKAYHILDELMMAGELQARARALPRPPQIAVRRAPSETGLLSRAPLRASLCGLPRRALSRFPSVRARARCAGAEQKDHLARDGSAGRPHGGQRRLKDCARAQIRDLGSAALQGASAAICLRRVPSSGALGSDLCRRARDGCLTCPGGLGDW